MPLHSTTVTSLAYKTALQDVKMARAHSHYAQVIYFTESVLRGKWWFYAMSFVFTCFSHTQKIHVMVLRNCLHLINLRSSNKSVHQFKEKCL